MYSPRLLEDSSNGLLAVNLDDDLFSRREIFLVSEVNSAATTSLLMQLKCLEYRDNRSEITLYINSPGGDVRSGLVLYDYIRQMKAPVRTVCIGLAASMASILFLAGDKREMFEHSEIMIHDPAMLGSGYEKPTELRTRLDQLMEVRETLAHIIADRTGMPLKAVYKATQTDTFYTAEQALGCGIATKIIHNMEAKNYD